MKNLIKRVLPKKYAKLQTADGKEITDPKPAALPLGFKRPKTLAEQVEELTRSARLRYIAESQGLESFEDADDFDVGDDFDPTTPYERDHDLAAAASVHHGATRQFSPAEVQEANAALNRYEKAKARKYQKHTESGPTPGAQKKPGVGDEEGSSK